MVVLRHKDLYLTIVAESHQLSDWHPTPHWEAMHAEACS